MSFTISLADQSVSSTYLHPLYPSRRLPQIPGLQPAVPVEGCRINDRKSIEMLSRRKLVLYR